MKLLASLASEPRLSVQLVSGRPFHTLQEWFGALAIGLWAEHGFWHRGAGAARWTPVLLPPHQWSDGVARILEQFAAATPGAWVERKTASLAWHYRRVDPELGARRALELRRCLREASSGQPLDLLDGHNIIEVRLRGVSKAIVAERLSEAGIHPTSIVAFGDDRTDEELFSSLPADSITIAVGRRLAGARFAVRDHRDVRGILHQLVAAAASQGTVGIMVQTDGGTQSRRHRVRTG
jgi:trehalose 6-phosphate synthase/phosphatase